MNLYRLLPVSIVMMINVSICDDKLDSTCKTGIKKLLWSFLYSWRKLYASCCMITTNWTHFW
jgi:hypothetical protein